MTTLEGKVVLVTGAAGGIGSVTATTLGRSGARLVLVDRDEASLRAAAARIESDPRGTEVDVQVGDVTSADSVERCVAGGVARFGGLHGVFNNAGIEGEVAPTEAYTEPMFDRVLDVNVKGVWLVMRSVIPVLRAGGGGSIVNTGSGASIGGLPGLSAYVASKHAVLGLTRTAALELAPEGIRVNAVCPGPVATRMMDALEQLADPSEPERARSMYESGVPMRRYATAQEVANLVAFLLSDAASYMTGAAVSIDGGFSAS